MSPDPFVDLVERLRQAADAAGLFGLGVCSAEPFDRVASDLESRVAAGLSGRLTFTFTNPERATDVSRSAPWAQRLVVGAVSYMPAAGRPAGSPPGAGRVARFATEDHYRPLRSGLGRVAAELDDEGYRTLVLVDDNRLVDRAAAVRAGIGWWGKNSMVLAPGAGPWLLLGSILTDAALPVDEPMTRDCGTCQACLPACPTGALIAPGILDASRCIAHWLQAPGIIPLEFRAAIGDRFYGCDDCIEACPPGKRLLEAATADRGWEDMSWVLAADDDELLQRFTRFYVPRRDPAHLRRNALVVLGNVGGAGALTVVSPFLRASAPLLRAHAVWATARLGGHRLLEEVWPLEEEPEVLQEYLHVQAGRVAERSPSRVG